MITLTLTFPDLDQLQAFLNRASTTPAPLVVTAAPATPPATVTVVDAPKAEAPAATPDAPETVITTAPEPAAAAPVTESPSEPEPTPEPEEPVDQAAVSKAITDLAIAGKREHVVAVLAKFGAKRGVDIKVEDRRAFLVELGQ